MTPLTLSVILGFWGFCGFVCAAFATGWTTKSATYEVKSRAIDLGIALFKFGAGGALVCFLLPVFVLPDTVVAAVMGLVAAPTLIYGFKLTLFNYRVARKIEEFEE